MSTFSAKGRDEPTDTGSVTPESLSEDNKHARGSGKSVPQDSDVNAAKEAQPQVSA